MKKLVLWTVVGLMVIFTLDLLLNYVVREYDHNLDIHRNMFIHNKEAR